MDVEGLARIRKQKGFEIANKMKILSQDGIWLIHSRSHPDKHHIVTLGLNKSTCTCKDFTMRVLPCKYIFAVRIRIASELSRNNPKMKERPTYPQNWSAYNKVQTQEKNLFMRLLHELCSTLPEEHEMESKHHRIKAHVCCGTKTHVITAVNVTKGHENDSIQFVPLATQTQKNGFQIVETRADKVYPSSDNLSHIAKMGGAAFVPFKSDTAVPTPDKQYTLKKMYNYFTFNKEEFMQYYHKRSNVESTFSMLKARFTDLIRSKNETAQINGVLLKVLCHNICVIIHEMFELGTESNFLTPKKVL